MTRSNALGSARRAAILVLAATALLAGGNPALAHRDGCHRHHSCPSDSGSYVCGDTGNYSQCPSGGGSEPTAEYQEPASPVDYTEPDPPQVTTPSVLRGLVSVLVTAERGSSLVVTSDGGATVARARGTGSQQRLSFRGLDGTHTYSVSATDSAGNSSTASTFEAEVDGTAPAKPVLSVVPAVGLAALTEFQLTGERGTQYSLRLARRGVGIVRALSRDGRFDDSGQAAERLPVPNGQYVATVTSLDAGGNTSAVTTTPVAVELPMPTLEIRRSGPLNTTALTLVLTGPALGTGIVRLSADGPTPVEMPFTLDDTGAATVASDVADGTYVATGQVLDFQKRAAEARIDDLLVDTVAPTLEVEIDEGLASKRTIAAAVTAEAGSTVTVFGLPGEGDRTLTSDQTSLRATADDGDYAVTFVATDVAGNTTELVRRVSVTHPLTLGEGLIAVLLFGLPVGGLVLAWRRRDRIKDRIWQRRAQQAGKRLLAEHATQVAAYESTVTAHAQAMAAYDDNHRRWETETGRLRTLANEARTYDGYSLALPDGIKRQPGEVVFSNVDSGGLIELRRPNGVDVRTVIDRGGIWITNKRVLFDGEKRREWSFDKLEEVSHPKPGSTLMRVSNRQKPSGIEYGSSQQAEVQRHFDLALATHRGDRDRLVNAAEGALLDHEASPPRPPVGPDPAPPPAPVLPTADDLRRAAGKLPNDNVTIPSQYMPSFDDAEPLVENKRY